jgi:hypothetical protein
VSMLRRRIATTYNDQLMGYIKAYQKQHPGPARMSQVAAWVCQQGLWEPRRISPSTLLTRELKHAARESRITDPQGHRLRAMLPAKLERMDINGNKVFDVVWDHVFEMSAHHGLLFLSQQYENIEKQCRSHNRVKASVLKNNPNFQKVQLGLFDYDFRYTTGETKSQSVNKIEESPIKPR